jgi:hypothetical protein
VNSEALIFIAGAGEPELNQALKLDECQKKIAELDKAAAP